jgi:hypothetical protein
VPSYPAENPLNKLQAALVVALKGSPSVMAVLPGGVHDEPPEGVEADYLVLADALSLPDHSHDKWGREITQTFHIWTKARGMKRAQAVMNAVTGLLDHQNNALTLAGHRIVIIRNEFEQVLRDSDPEWRQGLIRFRIHTVQLEA